MAPRLPVLGASADAEGAVSQTCAGCPAPCCSIYVVRLSGRDLFRLCRGLGLPHGAFVEVEAHHGSVEGGFRLAPAGPQHTLRLRRSASGACGLLLDLEGGHRRCGVYPLRPDECRVFPLVASDHEREGSFVWGMAVCPDERKALFAAGRGALRGLVDADLAERWLYGEVLRHWEVRLTEAGGAGPIAVERYITWLLQVYERIEPLRTEAGWPAWPVWIERAAEVAGTVPLD